MARTVEAVFENGVFRPLEPVKLDEGRRVQIYIPWADNDVTPEQQMKALRDLQDSMSDWTEADWAEFEQSFKRGK